MLVTAAVALAVAAIRSYQVRSDACRRDASRAESERRQQRQQAEKLVREAASFFPFVQEQLRAGLENGGSAEDVLSAALTASAGVRLGEARITLRGTEIGFPAVWSSGERQKGGYLVGRTGSGKTTLLVRCVKSNIDSGDGVAVIAPERELFVETLLPLCADRAEGTIYYCPGDPSCPIYLGLLATEPGEDRARCAAEAYNALATVMGPETVGARTGPILANALTVLVGRRGSTLLDIKRMFEDRTFRDAVVRESADEYARDFWTRIYPTYPANAHVPAVNKLDEFLRYSHLRRALCTPGNLSIRRALAEQRVLLVDLGGLDATSTLLLGQLVLGRVQVELMRRERMPTEKRTRFYLYCDEFQVTAGVAQESWRALLSRGRRYGLAVTLAHQFPSQVPTPVRDEILSNVSSVVAFSLGPRTLTPYAKSSYAVRRATVQSVRFRSKPW